MIIYVLSRNVNTYTINEIIVIQNSVKSDHFSAPNQLTSTTNNRI